MGMIDKVRNQIRAVFKREQGNIEKATEMSIGAQPVGFDTSSIYGRYGIEPLVDYLRIEQELVSRYMDYNEMCVYPELSAALECYADESCQFDILTGKTVWIESDDQQIKKLLQNLIDTGLQLDEEIWGLSHELCKYGNCFSELLCTGEGVIGLNALPPETIRRYEKGKGLLVGFAQDPRGVFGVTVDDVEKALQGKDPTASGMTYFEPWQILNMRLMGLQRQAPYGHSILESARWLWRRLLLLEDSALLYRLTRSPQKWLFYIDVGKLPPNQALGYLRRIKSEFTKNKFVNERGTLDTRFSPLAADENLFLPVVDGKRTTEVELMATPEWQVMDDINYFRDKLFTAIRIPKAYLAAEEVSRSRTLSLEDVRFARSIMRIQRELKNGIRRICNVHLAAAGIDPEKVKFDVFMTVPSWAYEMAQLEVRSARADFAEKIGDKLSERAILRLVFGFSDEEINALRKERQEEMREAAAAEGGGGEEKKSGAPPKTEGSIMDLPRISRVLPKDEEKEDKNMRVLKEKVDELLGQNKGIAESLEQSKDFMKNIKTSIMFQPYRGQNRIVKSLGMGPRRP